MNPNTLENIQEALGAILVWLLILLALILI
jgi:hypothetical protein